MKPIVLAAVFSLVVSNAFADHHEEGKKKIGHDKEHAHVEGDKMDHAHDEAHHKDHDHKAHHPDHVDSAKKQDKKKN
jgi:Ni/Co efflux regulator RcnB